MTLKCKFALSLICFLPSISGAMDRRQFLQGAGATASGIPQKFATRFWPETLTEDLSADFDKVYRVLFFEDRFPNLNPTDYESTASQLWSYWSTFQKRQKPDDPNIPELSRRWLTGLDLAEKHPEAAVKFKKLRRAEFLRIEADLAGEFLKSRVQIRETLAFILHPSSLIASTLTESTPNLSALPLTDLFIQRFLEKLAGVNPDLALNTVGRILDELHIDLDSSLNILSCGGLQWRWKAALDSVAPQQIAFENLDTDLKSISQMPKKTSEAWDIFKPHYRALLLRIAQSINRLNQLPDSAMRHFVLAEVEDLRSKVREDIRNFSKWYRAARHIAENAEHFNLGHLLVDKTAPRPLNLSAQIQNLKGEEGIEVSSDVAGTLQGPAPSSARLFVSSCDSAMTEPTKILEPSAREERIEVAEPKLTLDSGEDRATRKLLLVPKAQ